MVLALVAILQMAGCVSTSCSKGQDKAHWLFLPPSLASFSFPECPQSSSVAEFSYFLYMEFVLHQLRRCTWGSSWFLSWSTSLPVNLASHSARSQDRGSVFCTHLSGFSPTHVFPLPFSPHFPVYLWEPLIQAGMHTALTLKLFRFQCMPQTGAFLKEKLSHVISNLYGLISSTLNSLLCVHEMADHRFTKEISRPILCCF